MRGDYVHKAGFRSEVEQGFADAIWAYGYLQGVEQLVEDGQLKRTPWGPGDEITDFVPATPDELLSAAKREIARMARANGTSIEDAYEAAQGSDYDKPEDAHDFGWMLGATWLGSGAGFPDITFEPGNGEIAVGVDPDDLGEATVEYISGKLMTNGVEDEQVALGDVGRIKKPKDHFIFHQDDGHGWIAVKRKLLDELGIADQISRFSYVKGQTVYVEEDSDASKFFTAYHARFGHQPQLVSNYIDGSAPIRSYKPFTP